MGPAASMTWRAALDLPDAQVEVSASTLSLFIAVVLGVVEAAISEARVRLEP